MRLQSITEIAGPSRPVPPHPRDGAEGPDPHRTDPFPGRREPGRPRRHHSLEAILSDPAYSNGAKLVAARLDGYCLASGQFAAWPQMRRLANELGWSGTKDGGRKRVQRAIAELIDGGDLASLRVGAFVEWFDSSGGPAGLTWPRKLPRTRPMLASVYLLGWRISPEAPTSASTQSRAADVPRWQIGQDSTPADVPPPGTPMSHPPGHRCPTPSFNVRMEWLKEERTSDDGSALALGEGDRGASTIGGGAEVEQSPPAGAGGAGSCYSDAELAEKAVRTVRARGVDLRILLGPDGSELIEPVRISASAEPLPEELIARLKRLKPQVLDYLKGKPKPTRPGGPGPAPEVDPEAAGRFEALAGTLRGHRDPEAAEAAGDALCRVLEDEKAATVETFRGYCDQVRRGRFEPSVLLRAYRRASGPGVIHRGKRMVGAWKELTGGSVPAVSMASRPSSRSAHDPDCHPRPGPGR